MTRSKPRMLLVCLLFVLTVVAVDARAWEYRQAALATGQEDLASPPTVTTPAPPAKPIQKVKVKEIVKCRPPAGFPSSGLLSYGSFGDSVLPITRPRGWEFTAEAIFARAGGKARLVRGVLSYVPFGNDEVSLTKDIGIPEHNNVVPSFSATYRFRPQWALRYSIMPFVIEGTNQPSRSFNWGTTTHGFASSTRSKWERIDQRIGLVYDPIRTYSTRVSVFGEYMRVNERLTLIQVGCCGDSLDNDLNMAMAGLEMEKSLRTSRECNTLSLECRAGVAFGDGGLGSDLSTGLKYSIPMNNGRWGFIKGGYRYLSLNKKFSDAKLIDTTLDGGFVQMGVVF